MKPEVQKLGRKLYETMGWRTDDPAYVQLLLEEDAPRKYSYMRHFLNDIRQLEIWLAFWWIPICVFAGIVERDWVYLLGACGGLAFWAFLARGVVQIIRNAEPVVCSAGSLTRQPVNPVPTYICEGWSDRLGAMGIAVDKGLLKGLDIDSAQLEILVAYVHEDDVEYQMALGVRLVDT